MPLRNRVTPFGDIVADPARGLLMGNRGGRIHDPATRTLLERRFASRRWIACATRFKGRRRQVFGQSYTELFFLDEATALAAGHRPCFECRRAAAQAFMAALSRGLGPEAPGDADALDRRLHAERLLKGRQRRTRHDAATLPTGTMIAVAGRALALRDGAALPWTPAGYGPAEGRPVGEVEVLTPLTTVAALREGYPLLWHSTAHGP